MSGTQSSQLHQQLGQTALAFVNSYRKARIDGVKSLSATLTPDCRRFLAPVSLLQMLPEHFRLGETNSHYEERMAVEYEQTDPGKESEVLDVVIDEVARKVVVDVVMYTKSKATSKEYPFEFVFTLSMIDDGTKVKEIRQNADTGMARIFLDDMQLISEKIGGMEESNNK